MHDKLLLFSVLLFSVFAVPIIAGRTKIPAIVFYILFGVAIESFVFRLSAVGESFYVFSEVGKLYLMFIAGVEIDTYLFKKNAGKSVIFGVLSFVVPQVLGTAIIISVFGYSIGAALLTASLFASHTLLSLAIINKFGLGNSKPVSVVVGATIITDIAVLALLAVVADVARETDKIPVTHWVMLFGSWVLFIGAIIYLLPKVARRVFEAFSEDGYAQFLFVFAAACLLSWAAHFLRLESLIGAFFCGLALSRLIPNQSILMTKINFVGNTIFIPFFFVSAGMLISPEFFVKSGDALILAIVLTALAMATKTAASFICGKMFKFSKDAILMTAGMTIQQAATTIVCAVIGYEVGVINETIFNAGMLHILLTCTIGEIISVHYAERYARSLQAAGAGVDAYGGVGTIENSRSLVFIPNAAASQGLLDFACYFRHYAKRYTISPLALAVDDRESAAEAEAVLGICMNHANELSEVYRPEMRISGSVADGLMRAAAETRAGMAICPMESHSQALVDECPARLVFARIARGFPATKRVAAVFMPTSENRSDLAMLIAEIRHLSRQIGARAVFYISESQREKISAKIDKYIGGDASHTITVLSQWSVIKRDLLGLIGEGDAVIVAMGTRQKLFRLPSADRYPMQLAQRLKQTNIIAAYPPLSLVGAGRGDEAVLFHDDAPLGRAGGMGGDGGMGGMGGMVGDGEEELTLEAVDRGERDFRDIVISIAYKIGAHVGELYDILLPSIELYPVELIPEAVLVHAHTEAVDRPRAFLWYQRERADIPPTNVSPNVLIVVLNPLHGDPQAHLKTLSRVAGMFMNPGVGGVIAGCKDSGELVDGLMHS